MKLRPCSCKYFKSHSEISSPARNCNNALYSVLHQRLSEEISSFHEKNFVPVRVRTGLNSIRVVPAPTSSETGPTEVCMGSDLKSCRSDFVRILCNLPPYFYGQSNAMADLSFVKFVGALRISRQAH